MLFISRCLKFMSCVLGALLLSQCTTVTESPVQAQVTPQLVSPYTMTAPAYLALAKNKTGDEKQALLIKAAARLIFDGQWQDGQRILSQQSDLPVELANEKTMLLAKIDLIREQPRAALSKLATVQDINQLPMYYQVQFHEMLAVAYKSMGNVKESVGERIKLGRLLPDEASKASNRRSLWLTLTTLPLAELDTLAVETKDGTDLDGWLQLALVSRQHYANPQMMLAQIEQWRATYPQHPGNYILPTSLEDSSSTLFASPRKIALLLPVTGPLAGPGGAIKDGFMAGLQANNASDVVSVHVYNTDAANAETLYQQAVTDGADYIVGPLSKPNVATVAALEHPVPTLLLNDVETRPVARAYQFGLSPSNEARQVANKARKNGFTRALVIAPAGDWGNEITAAFVNQWHGNGGSVVDALRYNPNDDMNKGMRNFLHISDSEARGKQLKQLLGYNLEANPSRRQDFDMIFLLAYPSKARQIMPLLRYYYAQDVPVYATSAAYAGTADAKKDKDLNGLIFCDMPWVFGHQAGSRNWPEQFNSYNRLYALGMDSYALSTQLNQLLLFPAMGVSDKSGVLYLNSSQQITRVLAWGQFKQGLPEKMGETG